MSKVRTMLATPHGPNIPPGASRGFIQLVKSIGEAGSNHEEDRVIRKEAQLLQQKMKDVHINPRQMKEYLVRMMYCEMLGHDADFGYIHAVKLAQHASILEKRIGYLAVSVLLHEDHELMLLLVNTMQRDLKSTNVVEICTALTAMARVMNAEMIPAVLPLVEKLASHSREIVRKKAILAMHRFYTRSAASIGHLNDTIRGALCDADPGVMAASLNIFYDMARKDATPFKDLVPSFVSILKQIIERRLPRDFDYHKVPAPWMQIKLLKLLALLGKDDQSASEAMYEVIRDCLQWAESQSTAAYAVVYECLSTITRIYPSPELVSLAGGSIGRFLQGENNNLKYLGITALVEVVQVNPAYAAEHQMVVIDCLDDPDETLKRKTLELLCKMTNPENVVVITEKLVGYLQGSVDPYLRKDLAPRIVQLAERFAPDNLWFVETMLALFESAGDVIPGEALNNVLALIANPDSGSDEEDAELRLFAFETCMELLEKPRLPDMLTQAVCWIVGEYAYLGQEDFDQSAVIEVVTSLLDRPTVDSVAVRGWILAALVKLVSQTGLFPEALRSQIDKLMNSRVPDTQQRCYELIALTAQPILMRQVLPLDSSLEDVEIDPDMHFLDGVVQAALRTGARPYKPKAERVEIAPESPEVEEEPAMRFDAYENPEKKKQDTHAAIFRTLDSPRKTDGGDAPAVTSPDQMSASELAAQAATVGSGGAPAVVSRVEAQPTLKAKNKRWGRGGDALKKAAPPPAQAAAPTADAQPAPAVAVEPTLAAEPAIATPVVSPEPEHQKEPEPEPEPVQPVQPERVILAEPSEEEKAKKERAAALFAGTGASSGRTKRASRARKSAASTTPSGAGALAAPTIPVVKPTPGGSLLGDLGFGSPAEPAPTAAVGGPPAYGDAMVSSDPTVLTDGFGGSLDALGLSSGAPAGPPAQTASGDLLGGNLLGDLLGGMSSSTAPAAVPAAAPAFGNLLGGPSLGLDLGAGASSTAMGGGDLLGGLGLGGGAAAASASNTSELPADLTSYRNRRDGTRVSTDTSIEVTAAHVWKNDEIVLVLFFQNKTQGPIPGVSVSIDASAELQLRPGSTSKFTLSLAAPGSYAQQVLRFGASTISTGAAVQGNFTYGGNTGYIKIGLQAGDVVRPCPITTDVFASQWDSPQFAAGQRAQSFPGVKLASAEGLMQSLAEGVNLHPIQVIGSEAILCGQILGNASTKCLVHGTVSGSKVDLMVRSASAQFSQAVMTNCGAALGGSATMTPR
mmetsp:Transcript_23757/g.62092  ORF Transcript_23757/g.62092 Transcript_23757/m.62092 type:complete len:1254 (+) Transcript_23757:47-3808(+)